MQTATRQALAVAFLVLGTATAQMEKRRSEHYAETVFASRAPAIGTPAPNLQLTDLEGRARSLHQERGRKLVLIAGSFT